MEESNPKKRKRIEKDPILIVFDMNGVLISRAGERKKDVQLRNHLDTLLDTLWRLYPQVNVAVWSSMMSHNLIPLVQQAFGPRAADLAFVWDQQFCTSLYVKTMTKKLLRKDLKWLKGSPWSQYSPDHVLLIDDDPKKCGANPPGTSLHPATFAGEDDDDLLVISGYIEAMVKSDCRTVPEFVLANPYKNFGRDAAEQDFEGDPDFETVEVYQAEEQAWTAGRFVEELADGRIRVQIGEVDTKVVPAEHVRDLGSKETAAKVFAPPKDRPDDYEDVEVEEEPPTQKLMVAQSKPKPLPHPWQQRESRSQKGAFYYYNPHTGESTLKKPIA